MTKLPRGRRFEEDNDVVTDVAEALELSLFDFASAVPSDVARRSDGRRVNEAGALLKVELSVEFPEFAGILRDEYRQEDVAWRRGNSKFDFPAEKIHSLEQRKDVFRRG